MTSTWLLDWTEQNGPPVTAPAKRGFGTTLIERGLAHDLSGEARDRVSCRTACGPACGPSLREPDGQAGLAPVP